MSLSHSSILVSLLDILLQVIPPPAMHALRLHRDLVDTQCLPFQKDPVHAL